ncbi:MAG: hypothetical protein LBB42_00765 [Coriobacteriales bacterium]|jgi:hypothetical protein|nr:hypothetical protein [Coriobacteriales bacterium]
MNLYFEELKKVFIKQKLLLLLFLFFTVKVALSFSGAYQQVLFHEKGLQEDYLSYMVLLEGPLTPEKEDALLSDKSRSDESDARLNEAVARLGKGQIAPGEFYDVVTSETPYQNKKPVIEHLYSQYQYVSADPDRRYFVNSIGWSSLIADELPDFLLILAVLVFCTVIFRYEYKNQMSALNHTSANGTVKLAAVKIAIIGSLCLIVTIGLYAINLLSVCLLNGLDGFSYPIQSIPFYSSSSKAISLGQLLANLLGLRLLGVVFLMTLILLLYLCVRSSAVTLTAGLVVTIVPMFIFGMNGLIFRIPLPVGYLIGTGFYRGNDSFLLDDGNVERLHYLFREVPDIWFVALVATAALFTIIMLFVCVIHYGRTRGIS